MTATIVRSMSVKLDADMRNRFELLAAARRGTPQWILREAVAQYVEREEKRESFRQDVLDSWAEHKSSGLHLTADEADTWLIALEEGNDIEPPECHV